MSKRGKHPNSLANLKPARPGEVRNPRGRPKAGLTLTEALRNHLLNKTIDGRPVIEILVENLVNRALKSSADLNMIWERIEGKVVQQIQQELSSRDFNINVVVSNDKVKEMVQKVLAGERTDEHGNNPGI